jgi:putative NIF3 family GTP cyclohydrolase 1 type 2
VAVHKNSRFPVNTDTQHQLPKHKGVNDWLAQGLCAGAAVHAVKPLPDGAAGGSGRMFDLAAPTSVGELVDRAKRHLQLAHVRVAPSNALLVRAAGDVAAALEIPAAVTTVGVQAGSGASVLAGCGAGLWVTGEASHHEVLEANATGTTVVLTDHSNTERGFLPHMRNGLLAKLTAAGEEPVEIFVSEADSDPLHVV